MNVIVPKTVSEYEAQYNVSNKAANIVKKLMSTSEQEILAQSTDNANMNCDAVFLYTLYKSYGFTVEQLKAFFNEASALYKAECKADEYRANFGVIPQRAALKEEIGIDIKTWFEEVE